MHAVVDLTGLHSVTVAEVLRQEPGGPAAGSVLVQARRGSSAITLALPRALALALHAGLDPWVRAIHEENDHGPKPSTN